MHQPAASSPDQHPAPKRGRQPHVERHFTASDTVRDVVIGMADGLTVPFALAAGLAGAVPAAGLGGAIGATGIIVTAGIAEIVAGAVAMGLGGYLAARSDAEHYANERLREEREVIEKPQAERREVGEIFEAYGLNEEQIRPILDAFENDHEAWVEFMMRYELGLEEPTRHRGRNSAITIALSYVFGGFIPLSPYIITSTVHVALIWSVIVTLVALLVFGYVKGRLTGNTPIRSAIQTAVVGGIAAAAAFGLAKLVS